jgi:hypothetical protein
MLGILESEFESLSDQKNPSITEGFFFFITSNQKPSNEKQGYQKWT